MKEKMMTAEKKPKPSPPPPAPAPDPKAAATDNGFGGPTVFAAFGHLDVADPDD